MMRAMPVRPTVFMSPGERRHFETLAARWGDGRRLYPNLPVLNIIDVTPGDPLMDFTRGDVWPEFVTLEHGQFEQLKKASVDYVLCDDDGRPLVGVDFDGYGGESRLSSYMPAPGRDDRGAYMLNLKLKALHGQGFPYVVVNDTHFADLSGAEKLSTVDAIVGRALATAACQERLQRWNPSEVGMSDAAFEALSPPDQDESIRDWAIGVEVESLFEFDRLTRALGEAQVRTPGVSRHSIEPMSRPPITASSPAERLRQARVCRQVGARCTLYTDDHGEVTAEVWLSNSPLIAVDSIAWDLAHLRALRQLARLRTVGHVASGDTAGYSR